MPKKALLLKVEMALNAEAAKLAKCVIFFLQSCVFSDLLFGKKHST